MERNYVRKEQNKSHVLKDIDGSGPFTSSG